MVNNFGAALARVASYGALIQTRRLALTVNAVQRYSNRILVRDDLNGSLAPSLIKSLTVANHAVEVFGQNRIMSASILSEYRSPIPDALANPVLGSIPPLVAPHVVYWLRGGVVKQVTGLSGFGALVVSTPRNADVPAMFGVASAGWKRRSTDYANASWARDVTLWLTSDPEPVWPIGGTDIVQPGLSYSPDEVGQGFFIEERLFHDNPYEGGDMGSLGIAVTGLAIITVRLRLGLNIPGGVGSGGRGVLANEYVFDALRASFAELTQSLPEGSATAIVHLRSVPLGTPNILAASHGLPFKPTVEANASANISYQYARPWLAYELPILAPAARFLDQKAAALGIPGASWLTLPARGDAWMGGGATGEDFFVALSTDIVPGSAQLSLYARLMVVIPRDSLLRNADASPLIEATLLAARARLAADTAAVENGLRHDASVALGLIVGVGVGVVVVACAGMLALAWATAKPLARLSGLLDAVEAFDLDAVAAALAAAPMPMVAELAELQQGFGHMVATLIDYRRYLPAELRESAEAAEAPSLPVQPAGAAPMTPVVPCAADAPSSGGSPTTASPRAQHDTRDARRGSAFASSERSSDAASSGVGDRTNPHRRVITSTAKPSAIVAASVALRCEAGDVAVGPLLSALLASADAAVASVGHRAVLHPDVCGGCFGARFALVFSGKGAAAASAAAAARVAAALRGFDRVAAVGVGVAFGSLSGGAVAAGDARCVASAGDAAAWARALADFALSLAAPLAADANATLPEPHDVPAVCLATPAAASSGSLATTAAGPVAVLPAGVVELADCQPPARPADGSAGRLASPRLRSCEIVEICLSLPAAAASRLSPARAAVVAASKASPLNVPAARRAAEQLTSAMAGGGGGRGNDPLSEMMAADLLAACDSGTWGMRTLELM